VEAHSQKILKNKMTSQRYQTSYWIHQILMDDSETFSRVILTGAQVYDINGTVAMIEKDRDKPESIILTMFGKEEEIKRHISRLEKGVKIETLK